jgi:hypothetical protein
MGRSLVLGAICATLTALPSAHAQTAGIPPSCAISGGNFICTTDLDGTGKQSIIVGNIRDFSVVSNSAPNVAPFSYMIIVNNTGAIRREICWAAGSNQTAATCPVAKSSAAASSP